MVLREELVHVGLEAADAEGALRAMADGFVQLGVVKDSYPDAVVERERVYPTGLECKSCAVAIPHCAASYVNQTAVGIAVLREPLPFSLMSAPQTQVPVRVVFMLAIAEPAEQVPVLVRVMEMADDEQVMGQILAAGTSQDVMAAVGDALEPTE